MGLTGVLRLLQFQPPAFSQFVTQRTKTRADRQQVCRRVDWRGQVAILDRWVLVTYVLSNEYLSSTTGQRSEGCLKDSKQDQSKRHSMQGRPAEGESIWRSIVLLVDVLIALFVTGLHRSLFISCPPSASAFEVRQRCSCLPFGAFDQWSLSRGKLHCPSRSVQPAEGIICSVICWAD